MKKTISLFIVISMLISMVPFLAFAEDTTYGLAGNPIIIDSETSVFYELETYPCDGQRLLIRQDSLASGGKSVYLNSMTSEGPEPLITLSIETSDIHKIKFFARVKTTGNKNLARVQTAKNSDKRIERPFFMEEANKYYWVCLESCELEQGEDFTFNIYFDAAATYVDKLFITADIQEFPVNMSDTTNEIDMSYLSEYYPDPDYYPVNGHPRVFINQSTLPKIRQNMTHSENKIAYESLIKNAATVPTGIEFQKGLRYMLSNAFLSVVEEDSAKKEEFANKAVTTLFNGLSVKSDLKSNRETRSDHVDRAYRIHVISLVYDWCYNYLTEEQKKELFAEVLFYLAQYEMTYPPALTHGSNNGHISEAEVFLGLLSAALAFYDEYPDMYSVIGGKLFHESIDARNFYYEIGNHTQGSNYMSVRMANEFHLFSLLEAGVGAKVMSDGADELLMEYIYGKRPDTLMFRNGDANGPDSDKQNITSLFAFSNYLNNGYLKDEVTREYPTPTLAYNANGISDYLWIIFNDPDVERKSYKELPLTRFTGMDSGIMYARTSWEMGKGDYSDALAVRLNLEPIYGGGHDHLDIGHFDIYYKGALALDSGFYPGTDEDHHRNYFKRTVAHNAMLLYDPDEKMDNRYSGSINDGGQKYLETTSFPTSEEYREEKKAGEVLAADYGDNMYNPSFSYMKGDLTKAYATTGDKDKVHNSEKMKKYTRSFVFLNFFDDVYPGALIVFDKMTSNNPAFKKTWLLHTQEEPEIKDGTTIASKTENGDNGRLINETLLPKAEDRTITKIGGKGKEFVVNGTNYPTNDRFENKAAKHTNDFGKWRIELSPKTQKATDYFLNVIHVTENDNSITPLNAELIEATDFAGVKIKDRVAFFSLTDELYEKDITFTVSGNENYEILVTDVLPGAWDVYKDGVKHADVVATENGKNLSFKGNAGTYTLKKDTADSSTYVRNMNYLDYTTTLLEEPIYTYFNNALYDIPVIEDEETIYVEAKGISEIADCDFTNTNGNITYSYDGVSLSVPTTSEAVILRNGKYYVDILKLRDLFYITYTKPVEDIYNITLTKRNVTVVRTGEEFNSITFADKGLYIINGSQTLNDGSKGIIIPDEYQASSKTIKGVITGIDEKNNIQLPDNTPLFKNTAATAYTAVNNINLKGKGTDGRGNLELSLDYVGSGTKANGALICYAVGAIDLEIKNVNNYINITSNASAGAGVEYVGGLLGYTLSGVTTFDNCVNYGNVDVDYDHLTSSGTSAMTGGFVGRFAQGSSGITTLNIYRCKNYGNINSKSNYTGGFIGCNLGEKSALHVAYSANYGAVTSSYTGGVGGIIGGTSAKTLIEKTYNAGNISSPGSWVCGIIGGTSVVVASASYGSGYNSTYTIENCFNIGNITNTRNNGAYGLVNRVYGTVYVRNCYNAGTLGDKSYEITNAPVENCYGNYYINANQYASNKVGTYISLEELANTLPIEFSDLVWEYTFNEGENKYSLPQIIGNNIKSSDEKFYVKKQQISISITGDKFFTNNMLSANETRLKKYGTDEVISTAYVIVPARFQIPENFDDSLEYGMLLSDKKSGNELTKDVTSNIAYGKANFNGSFGILFYGRMEAGKTYYVRPFVKYNGDFIYGKSTSFVFPDMDLTKLSNWLTKSYLSTFNESVTTYKMQ